MTDRKFKDGLKKFGPAAIRENVSAALRRSLLDSQRKSVEPIDYEIFAIKNKILLHNDPQRDLLNFPHDDVSSAVIPRTLRTSRSTVPKNAEQEASRLLVAECIKTYTSDWNVIRYQYGNYASSYRHLPTQTPRGLLPEQMFEIDTEIVDNRDEDTVSLKSQSVNVTKKGWLYKGPGSYTRDNVISFTKQFKRRFFVLQQQADATYMLQFFKDDRKNDSKGAIFLDSAVDVQKNTKKGKHCFEIRMQDSAPHIFAGENESDMNDWIKTLRAVIYAAETGSCTSSERSRDDVSLAEKDEKKEMNPELVKYSRETDSIIQKARQENRQKLFSIYPDIQKGSGLSDIDEDMSDVLSEQQGKRYLLRFEEFRLKLQANISEDGCEKLSNPEPFFIVFSLYDIKYGKKLSADFHIDPNSPDIKTMIPAEVANATDNLHSIEGAKDTSPDLEGLDEHWLNSCNRQCIFSVMDSHPDIYVYVRIEKVLQGSISQCVEPYCKYTEIKAGTKVHKTMKQFCSFIGHYRMPFAWAARPLLTPFSGSVDTFTNFTIYKQESSKMSEEEILKNLNDLKRPEKLGKWQEIPATFKVNIDEIKDSATITGSVTSAFVPVEPFSNTRDSIPTFEVDEFPMDSLSGVYPHMRYLHHLYVYPMSLKFEHQKAFTKARNIACCMEVRDSDDINPIPLKRIYGRANEPLFTTVASTPVIHHASNPEFHEEIKINLPTQLHDRHHLLFRFYHVSCEGSKGNARASLTSTNKRRDNIETQVGYAWLPILHDGR